MESALEGIREKYDSEFYPFEVKQSGGGWQFLTKVDFYKTIAQLNGDKFLKRLSNAALETLAIIAYKQPITKGEIEAIRGVNSDYSIQKLLEKELVLISGRNENMPGKPLVYATSKNFMDYFGINSPNDLPKIREVLAEQIVEGTIINPEDFTDHNVAEVVTEPESYFSRIPSSALSTWSSMILSSRKPNVLLISSTISKDDNGFSLAKISTSMCGMIWLISISKF